MAYIYYYEKTWWNVDPIEKPKKRVAIDPQPKKPPKPLRPRAWVEFYDPYFKESSDFKTCVGRINHVIKNTDTGDLTYVVHLAWSRFDVKKEHILHRMLPEEETEDE